MASTQKFASQNFSVTNALDIKDKLGNSDTNLNFDAKNLYDTPFNTLYFSAAFNEEVSWTVRIDAKASHAFKEIHGTGKNIDITNATWQGDATSAQFFYSNSMDTCVASLFVAGKENAVSTRNLVIAKLKSLNNTTVNGVRYLIVEDFDFGPLMGPNNFTMTDGSIDNVEEGNAKFLLDSLNRIQGKRYLKLQGKDNNNNSWLISVNHPTLVEMVNTASTQFNISSTNSDNFYVNIYINGKGKSSSGIELKMYELDCARSPQHLIDTIVSNSLVFNLETQKVSDGFIYDIVIDWEGWKLVSIPYSAFHATNDLNSGGNGNRIKEPWKITGMAISLLSYPMYGQEVAADIDFITVSEGGPFVPKY